MSKLDRELLKQFRKVRDRIHSNIILNYAIIGIIAALLCSLMVALLSRLIPIYGVYSKATLIVLSSAFLAVLYGSFRTPSNRRVALKVDSIGLEERTLTAIELIGESSTFSLLQKEDALKHLNSLNFKTALPIKPNRKYLAICALLIAALAVSAFIPNQMDAKAKELNELHKNISQQQKKVTEIEKKIEKNKKLTPEQKKEAKSKLKELKKELKAAENQKDIDKALQKSEKKLEYLKNKYTGSKESLDKLVNSLSKNQATKHLAEMIKNGNEQQLKDDIKNFAEQLKKLNKDEIKQLSKDLKELTKQLKDNPELQQALSELAQKLADGELGDMTDALNKLSDSISEMMSDESFRQAMEDMAQQLSQMQEGQQSSQEGGNGKDGNGQQTSGQGQGQGTGQGQGQGTGGGAGSGTSMGQEKQAPIAPTSGIQKKDGSTNNIGEYEKIFSPKTIGGDGEQSNLQGTKGSGGSTEQITTDKAQTVRGSSVPYDQVIGEYKEQALDNISSSDIPSGMKDLVKDYFSSLEE